MTIHNADLDVIPGDAEKHELIGVAVALALTLQNTLVKLSKEGFSEALIDIEKNSIAQIKVSSFEGGNKKMADEATNAAIKAIEIAFVRVRASLEREGKTK